MAEIKEAPKKAAGEPEATKEATPGAPAVQKRAAGSTPLGFMQRFADEMDQLFEDFGLTSGIRVPRLLARGPELLRREARLAGADWSPRVEVLHRDGHMIIRAELPGLTKDDVKVEVHDNLVTIQGERKQEKKEEREGCSYSERHYGSFYRAIPLPEGAEGAKASAEFRNGVLEVSMPARAEARARRLEIKETK